VSYHQAREAEEIGLTVVDAGHWATERPVLDYWAGRLRTAAAEKSMNLEFEVLDVEADPWSYLEERNIEPGHGESGQTAEGG
jgi:putative NIF3 family GTP cyclohydrolase 1 type 2